jgi:glucosamine kinase
MRAVTYFLGIDGGGGKTTCVLGDKESVLASATVGGSNFVRLGESEARTALQQGVREVCRKAAIKPTQIAAICAGIAGVAREDIRKQVTGILAKLAPAQIEVVGDMVIAHEAARSGAPGIVVLAGTGSIAYGRHASGRTARTGGWGYAISDEGSGHWIGVQAVAAVTHALDAGSYTKLSDHILRHWGVRSYDDLICRANTSPLPDFAGLFPAVVAAAEAGDSYAHDVLARAGVELAGLAELVFRMLWKAADEVDVALAGGVFENSTEVRESFRRELKSSIPQAQISLSTRNAAEGALALARKLAAYGQTNP